jgi:hypothetical protein
MSFDRTSGSTEDNPMQLGAPLVAAAGSGTTARHSLRASRDSVARELLISAEHFLQNEERDKQRHWFPRGRNWRQTIHMLASGDGTSTASTIVTLISALLTFTAVVMSCYDISMENDVMVAVETICVNWFSLEYLVRLATARHRPLPVAVGAKGSEQVAGPTIRSFIVQPLNLVDFFTIAPYWISIAIRSFDVDLANAAFNSVALRVLRVMRFARMARAVRLIKYAQAFAVVGKGLERSSDHLVTLFAFLVVATILAGTIVFHVVKASATPDTLTSVPETFFFVLEQMADLTAVQGENEVVLDTLMGHIIGLVMMVCGVIFHGLTMASIMEGFKQAVLEQNEGNARKKKFKKTFRSAQDANGRATCIDLYKRLRKADPALAIALEPFGNLAVTETFFLAIMEEAVALDVTNHSVDMEMLFTAVELLQEDHAMLQHALSEQTQLLRKLADHHQIDTGARAVALPDGKRTHFYICCANVDGDLVHLVQTSLEKTGATVRRGHDESAQRWHDAEEVVKTTVAFVLLVTEGTLRSRVCQHEVRQALNSQLMVVVVHDSDTRRASSVDLVHERAHLPEDCDGLRELLESTELVALGRRNDKAEEMAREIMRRAGIATMGAAI